MKRFSILIISILGSVFLSGCVGTAVVMMEKRQAADLPIVAYKLPPEQFSYASKGIFVTDYKLKELWFGSKVKVEDLSISDYVKEALAKKTEVTADQKAALRTLSITKVEADAQFITFWMGPWAKMMISADVMAGNGNVRKVEVTGRCRMIADRIQPFTQEQTAQVLRNAASALVSALLEDKESVVIGKNMECLADGRVKLIGEQVLLLQ